MQKGVDIERHSGGGVVPAGSWIKFAFKADFSSLLLATKRTGKARTCKENDGDEKRRNNFSSHLCRSALHSAVASEPIVRGAIQ